jgi:hypothetical protein
MEENMIGRKDELKALDWDLSRPESQLVVVYGRRRIGKTYLIREKFSDQFVFYHTGVRGGTLQDQLDAFRASLVQYGYRRCPRLANWLAAFSRLSELVASAPAGRKVVFIDEMPWMDTPRSKLVSSFEYFWNNQMLIRKEKDVFMVVCGSATSWIVENIVHNKGGLHDRLTDRIWLRPFTLGECAEYAAFLGVPLSRHELCQAYMVFGGVPYYWSLLRGDRSLAQNVDSLCFSEHGKLRDEFEYLYASLFKNAAAHLKIVTALASCKSGVTRGELVEKTGITNGGTLKKALEELVRCDFVRQFNAWHKTNRDAFFQLTDNFTLFHFSFMGRGARDPHFWMNAVGGPRLANWEGQSFERLCLLHIDQIKKALGISGIGCEVYSWRSRADSGHGRGAQIDLVIERQDGNVNLCEMKFYRTPYEITAEEEEKLLNRREAFRADTATTANCRITVIAASGIKPGVHAGVAQNVLTIDDLFESQ